MVFVYIGGGCLSTQQGRNVIRPATSLPQTTPWDLTDKEVRAKAKSKTSLTSANLHYTTGTVPINKLDWESMSARVEGKRIISPAPPDEATIWFLTVCDDRGAVVSSELVFSTE